MGDLTNPANIEHIQVPAVDGYMLTATCFKSKTPSKDVLLLNSAAGVKRKFYFKFATFLSEQGFTVYTYDYRGIGDSRPDKLRGFKAYMREWGLLDMNGMMKYILSTHPDAEYYNIGHSIGGQILAMSEYNYKFKKVVTVGAQEGYWKYWDGIWKIYMFIHWHLLLPILTKIFGYFPAEKMGIAEDLPKGVALEWGSWGRNKNWFFDTVKEAQENAPKFNGELLGISLSDDNYAPVRAVDALMVRFVNGKIDRRNIHPREWGVKRIGHFGLFRSKFKETLWVEVFGFLETK